MKMTNKIIKLVLYVAGVLILVASYSLGYQALQDKKEVLEQRHEQLTAQAQKLDEIYQNTDMYAEETTNMENACAEIFAKYPAEVREEDAILYATDMEEAHESTISVVGLSTGEQLYAIGAPATDTAGQAVAEEDAEASTEAADATAPADNAAGTIEQQLGIIDASQIQYPAINLYSMAVSYEFSVGYEDCKDMVADIFANEDKRNVTSISLAYDGESGKLLGNMNVNMFYISGTEETYQSPDAGSMKHGRENIFGTMEIKNQSQE